MTPDPERENTRLSLVEQLAELMAALALNKSLLARILRVSRPTIYEWFSGKVPKQATEERLESILDILAQGSVTSSTPSTPGLFAGLARVGPCRWSIFWPRSV